MTSGLVTMYKGHMRLACKLGSLKKIGFFRMLFKETPNVSDLKWSSSSDNPQILIPDTSKSSPSNQLIKKRSSLSENKNIPYFDDSVKKNKL